MSDTSARRTEPPIVVSIISTKGGVGKTTTAANLGGFLADAGMRVLLLDLDIQPTLSSYFPLERRAPGGIYEMLAFNEQDRGQLISTTAIGGLDLLLSNDAHGQLNTLLLHAADGRLRLRNLLGMFRAHYDLLLIDTQGARSVLLEMAVLASDVSLSPVTPEILAARELRRGTLSLMEEIARTGAWASSPALAPAHQSGPHGVGQCPASPAGAAQHVPAGRGRAGSRHHDPGDRGLSAAALRRLPVHRVEYRQPRGRLAPAALESQRALAIELFPQWRDRLDLVTGRATHADPH